MIKAILRTGVIIVLCCPMLSLAALVHRYSFNGNADDSVGTSNGVLVNNSGQAAYQGNRLNLGNSSLPLSSSSTINYVDLPNGLISSLGSQATFELWITCYGPDSSNWQKIFDFGTSDTGEGYSTSSNNSTYICMMPNSGDSTYRVSCHRGVSLGGTEERIIESSPMLALNTELHVAFTWNDTASETRLYLNGQRVASGTTHFLLSQMTDNNNWLGRSQWSDPGFNGRYNEFRIYNTALTDEMILANYQAGPDLIGSGYTAPKTPTPANGELSAAAQIVLSWDSDDSPNVTEHRVYVGTNSDNVLTATPSTTGIYRGSVTPPVTSFPITLEYDTQYYWRIEEVLNTTETFSGPVWAFHTYNAKSHNPAPANNATGIPILGTNLQWAAGGAATSHLVYFGTSADNLKLIDDNYLQTSWPTGALKYSTAYYWRIDERENSGTIITGDLWSFTSQQGPDSCLPGDLDGNCKVELEDLVLFAGQWLNNIQCTAYDCADLDQNQHVNLSDAAVLASNWLQQHDPMVVINEIHYHSDNNKEPVEFIEIHNAGVFPVDLSGWKIEDAVTYTFLANTLLEANGYIVVSQNPSAITSKFSITSYGPWSGKLSNEGERIVLRNAGGDKIDEVSYDAGFPWPTAADGEGASMELLNPYLDNDLGGSWRPSGFRYNIYPDLTFGAPTPGKINSVYLYSTEVPPQIRQVNHQVVTPLTGQDPEQPRENQPIRITSKVTDPDGVKTVTLSYQVVAPGAYIPAFLPVAVSSLITSPTQRQTYNSAFSNFVTVTMYDDGTNGDLTAGDSVYSAILAGRPNRTLMRYRIIAADNHDKTIRVPYLDDASLNFVYFVYNGVPAYTANMNTVQSTGAPYTYNSDIMNSLPAYTLITRYADLYQCNGYSAGDRINQSSADYNLQEAGKVYNWEGTLIYDGKVYDHVSYRLRGGNGRYNYGNGGKRSMKFRFNRGSYFQARDIYGEKFPSKWQHLVTSKMIGNRLQGKYGVNELMDMRLWNLVGVPAPEGYWFTFRVIDGANEAPTTATGQYDGDFWGLYIGWEDYDNTFLERQGLPDGNLYKLSDKIYEGLRQLRYQAPGATATALDYENIRWNMTASATATFIQNYMDTDEWNRYHTIVEAVRCYDVFSGPTCTHCLKNAAWYFYPDYTAANNYYGKLWFMPFDVDDTWGPFYNQGIDHGAAAIFDQYYVSEGQPVQLTIQTAKAPLKQDYRNYIREFRDLHWQPEVINPMLDEMARMIEDIIPADRDRWMSNPSTNGGSRDDGSLSSVVADLKKFAWDGGSWTGDPWAGDPAWPGADANLDNLAGSQGDLAAIPNTPTITYTGPAGFPSNALNFQTSAFSDPQGAGTFAALKWRIAEVTPFTPLTQELIASNAAWKYFKGTREPSPSDWTLWRQIGFNDAGWLSGAAPIGYGLSPMGTVLSDMKNLYSTVYLRKTFEISDLSTIKDFTLSLSFNDDYNIWVNGVFLGGYFHSEENMAYSSLAPYNIEDYSYNDWSASLTLNPSYPLVQGTNVIAVQLLSGKLAGTIAKWQMTLTANLRSTETDTMRLLEHRNFEIEPAWESDDITPFSNAVRIPGTVVKAGHLYRVRCKMKDATGRWGHWSNPNEFTAGEPLNADILQNLRITELMYNPAPANTDKGELNVDNNEFEFVELKNIGSTTLDLSSVSFTNGITFSFSGSAITSLAPGQFVLVVRNSAAFTSRYPGLADRIAGQYTGKFDNGGEQVALVDMWNGTIVDFNYNDGYGWPISADGAGHSLTPIDSAIPTESDGSLQYGGNWRASTYINGSPGTDDPAPIAGIMINEVMAHTDYSDPAYPDYDSNDWIELYNPTGSIVGYNSNWYLSDDPANLKKWALPGGSIPAGGSVSFDEVTGFHNPMTSGFGLDKTGEYVFLSYLPGTSADRVVDFIKFSGQKNNISSGRYPDGGMYWFNLAYGGTRNWPNANPIGCPVVISEIMYHPDETTANDEYIELYNPTVSAVNLYNTIGPWRLDNAVSYVFAAGKSIPAGGKIVVVPFDPAVETERLAAFNSAYGSSLVASTTIFGPWTGDLSNAGERIALQEPQEADPPSVLTTWWINIDQVIYGDCSPWPTSPDGSGDALVRQSWSASISGDDPLNWTHAIPSPGN